MHVWHVGPKGAAGNLTSAGPSLWIKKRVCPLHDLVRREKEEKKVRDVKNTAKCVKTLQRL
jgi:hypothetical protein